MPVNALDEQVERIDSDLARDEVPVHARSLLTLTRLSRELGCSIPIADSLVQPNDDAISTRVSAWYRRRVLVPTDLAVVPISIRNTVFFARSPLGYGEESLNPLSMFTDVTLSLWRSLTPFSGYGEARTPWHDWEDGMDESRLVSDLLQRGGSDFWECSIEFEEKECLSRVATRSTTLAQIGRRIDCVEIAKPGRLRLHVRWSVPDLVRVSIGLIAVP
jgi:hypothetical protein